MKSMKCTWMISHISDIKNSSAFFFAWQAMICQYQPHAWVGLWHVLIPHLQDCPEMLCTTQLSILCQKNWKEGGHASLLFCFGHRQHQPALLLGRAGLPCGVRTYDRGRCCDIGIALSSRYVNAKPPCLLQPLPSARHRLCFIVGSGTVETELNPLAWILHMLFWQFFRPQRHPA